MLELHEEVVEVLPSRLELSGWKPKPTLNVIHIGSVNQVGINAVVFGYGNTQVNQNNISLGGYNNTIGG
jgi:hypothetical protein